MPHQEGNIKISTPTTNHNHRHPASGSVNHNGNDDSLNTGRLSDIGGLNILKNLLDQSMNQCCKLVSLIGGLILIVGVLIASINIIFAVFNDVLGTKYYMVMPLGSKRILASFQQVRFQLGMITALGLEVLVVADVLETVVKSAEDYTFEIIGKIAAIAMFRTVLAFMLGREVKEIKDEIEEMEDKENKEESKTENLHSKHE